MFNAATNRKTWRAWLLFAVACWALLVPAHALTFAPSRAGAGPKTASGIFFAQYGGKALGALAQLAKPHLEKLPYGYETASAWTVGLYYLRARYLNPDSGRFWSMDSFEGREEDPLSLHDYLYAHANPVTYRDPSGHMSLGELVEATGIRSMMQKTDIVTIHRWRRMQAKLCSVTAMFLRPMVTAYSKVKKATKGWGGAMQAHHVFQDAMIPIQALYSSAKGLAMILLGGSQFPGSPHDLANEVQRKNPGMRAIDKAWYALRAAGCRNSDATTIVQFVKDSYEMAGIVF